MVNVVFTVVYGWRQQQQVSMIIMGPLASTKEHQSFPPHISAEQPLCVFVCQYCAACIAFRNFFVCGLQP